MAITADGRTVPDFDDGPPTTARQPADATAARPTVVPAAPRPFNSMSLRTRLLGQALGAAETIVPAAGSPKQTLRQMAKAAKDYIVHGIDQGFAKTAFEQGRALGEAAKAGDPHAQGAAFAITAGTVLGAGRLLNAEVPPLTKAPVDLTPSPKPLPDPLDVPTFQRRPITPNARRFASDEAVRLDALSRRVKAEMPEVRGPFKLQAVDPDRLSEIHNDFGMYRALLPAEEQVPLRNAKPFGYDVINRRGDHEFTITGNVTPDGTAHIDIHGDQPGGLGTGHIKKVLRVFQQQHPEVKQIQGERVSGSRAAAEEAAYRSTGNAFVKRNVTVPLPERAQSTEQGGIAGSIGVETPLERLNKAAADFNAVDWDAVDATKMQRAGVLPEGVVGKIGTPEALVRAAIKKAGGPPSLPDEFSQPQFSGERARLQQLWDAGRTGTVRSLVKKYRSGELEIPRNVSRE